MIMSKDREDTNNIDTLKEKVSDNYQNQGLALGLIGGSCMALAMMILGHFIFGMFFIPIGISLGLAIGTSIKK